MPKCDAYYQHGLKFRCYKTPDMLECSCGGDPEKCDYFPKKTKKETIDVLREKYGLPTVDAATNAYYLLSILSELAESVEYAHNFQRERSDIVDYIKKTHTIMRILKGDINGK